MRLFLTVLLAVALLGDVPILRDGPTAFTTTGSLHPLSLTGQSSCAMVLSGSGSATITPKGSADGGASYATIPAIGAQTANGTYGAGIAPYITNFRVDVSSVTGTVTVSEACSAAITP